jgi:glyceraldehyde-3-phosphate dehydrogenase (NADP+)
VFDSSRAPLVFASSLSLPLLTSVAAFLPPACTREEVDAAYASAATAQKVWAKTPLWQRAQLLHRTATALRAHAAPLAAALVAEVAKPAKDAAVEVERSADLLSYTAEEGARFFGEGALLASDSFPGADRNKLCLAQRVPLGVVLAIPPFNYPINLAVSKLGPALVAGNAVVLKPPTQGAACGVMLARCFEEAGCPPGLLSVVTGRGSEIGDYLTTHPGARAISFTGGDTGLDIAKKAGMVPMQMELGGKDAAVVCADADVPAAAAAIAKGAFSYSGQRCTAVKLVLPVPAVADALVDAVVAKAAALSVGMPQDDAAITPLVSTSAADFVEGLVRDAEAKGATLRGAFRRKGNLIWPLVVDHVTAEMRLAHEEPFGPVLPVVRVASVDDAVARVNASRFALQGCVFTRDLDAAMAVADAMQTGTVQINAAPARGPDHFPFQGFRDSGIGSQGVKNSLEFFCKTKSVVLNLAKPSFAMG